MLACKPVIVCTQFMLVQPRLLQLDTLQEVEELQLLRSNVTDVDTVIGLVAVHSLAIPNVLPAPSHVCLHINTFMGKCHLYASYV